MKHTTPLCRGPANLLAAWLSRLGQVRLGFGVVLQQRLGMRPNEMLGICAEHVVLPEEQGLCPWTGHAEILLGAKKGTKVKRPQVVVVRGAREGDLLRILRLVKHTTPPHGRLVPISIDSYRMWLKRVLEVLRLPLDVTPHSPRAGFASEGRALGRPFTELQEEGRWASATSLRTYIDLAAAAAISAKLKAAGLGLAVNYCSASLELYFPASALAARYAR